MSPFSLTPPTILLLITTMISPFVAVAKPTAPVKEPAAPPVTKPTAPVPVPIAPVPVPIAPVPVPIAPVPVPTILPLVPVTYSPAPVLPAPVMVAQLPVATSTCSLSACIHCQSSYGAWCNEVDMSYINSYVLDGINRAYQSLGLTTPYSVSISGRRLQGTSSALDDNPQLQLRRGQILGNLLLDGDSTQKQTCADYCSIPNGVYCKLYNCVRGRRLEAEDDNGKATEQRELQQCTSDMAAALKQKLSDNVNWAYWQAYGTDELTEGCAGTVLATSCTVEAIY